MLIKLTTMDWMVWSYSSLLLLSLKEGVQARTPDYITGFKVTHGTCALENVIREEFNLSFQECVDECLLRKQCLSVAYYSPMQACNLRSIASITATNSDDTRYKCQLLSMSGLDNSHLGHCASKPCDEYFKCSQDIANNGYTCTRSECDPIAAVPNAHPRSPTTEVGRNNSYQCNHMYSQVRTGNQVQCHDNGTWSASDFECVRLCPRPADLKYASMVSDVRNSSFHGDDIDYQCFDGYTNYENKVNQTRTCTNGAWVGGVDCCRDSVGYVHELSRCFRLYDEVVSFDQAAAKCGETSDAYMFGIGNNNQRTFIGDVLTAENGKTTASNIWDSAGGVISPLLISSKLSNNQDVKTTLQCLVDTSVQAVHDKTDGSLQQLEDNLLTATGETVPANLPCNLSLVSNQYMNWAIGQPVQSVGRCITVSPDDPFYWTSVSCTSIVARAFLCILNYVT